MKEKVKVSFYKKWWVWFIAFAIVVFIFEEEITNSPKEDKVIVEETYSDQVDTDTEVGEVGEDAAEEVEEEVEITYTPREEMILKISDLFTTKQAFDTGSYIQGDIPVGEYAFVTFEGSGQYYSEKDAAGNIIDNENFDSFGYVYVHSAGNLQTDGVLINTTAFSTLGVTGAKQLYEVLNEKSAYLESGWYKTGVDIQPGQYTIESYGEGYVAIMSGPVGKNEIVDNEIFNGRYNVNVANGQYLKISGGKVAQ